MKLNKGQDSLNCSAKYEDILEASAAAMESYADTVKNCCVGENMGWNFSTS